MHPLLSVNVMLPFLERVIMEQNIVMPCRMAIYDEHFTVDEKLDAYQIYRDYGGNHTTKQFMDTLVGCDVDEYLERHGKD